MSGIKDKLRRIRMKLALLPRGEQREWNAKIAQRMSERKVASISGDGEWDLNLANWLDSVYTAVSDRATEVRRNVSSAAVETASNAGKAAGSLFDDLMIPAVLAIVLILAWKK